jgi:hypothetical protein
MSTLISRESIGQGNYTRIDEKYREESSIITDAYVEACMIVLDDYAARKLVLAGKMTSWKFKLKERFFVDMWEPGSGPSAITYTVNNETLWRAVAAIQEAE